jgi:ribosomal protein L11 methyltransferase
VYALKLTLGERDWPHFEALCNRLSPAGLLQEDSGTFGPEPVADGQLRITLYLAVAGHEGAQAQLLAKAERAGASIDLTGEALPDCDWNAAWKAHYAPLRIGRRLRIEPAWQRLPAEPEVLPIAIDPGQAFGTGTHETTHLAAVHLERLLDAWRGSPAKAPDVLDVGTGSGILAIAAVRLGAGRVVATDYDPEAIDNARENAALNQVAHGIELLVADDLDVVAPACFDLVVANIISGILLRLRDALVRRTRPGGLLLVSGVLTEERDAFLASFCGSELTLEATSERGEWSAMVLRRCP